MAALCIHLNAPIAMAATPFLLEGPLVAWGYHRGNPLVLCGATYWVLIGIPLQVLLGSMGTGQTSEALGLTTVILLISGCLNALLADLALSWLPLGRWLRPPLPPRSLSLHHSLRLALLICAWTPALVLTAFSIPREFRLQQHFKKCTPLPPSAPAPMDGILRSLLELLLLQLATFPLSQILSFSLLRPLKHFQSITGKMAEGSLDLTASSFPVAGVFELEELSRNLGSFLSRIQRGLLEIEVTRETLQQRLKNDQETPHQSTAELRDEIHRRELAEERLRLYHRIFLSNREAMLILDPEGNFLAQNLSARSLLGFEDRELTQNSLACFLEEKDRQSLCHLLGKKGARRLTVAGKHQSGASVLLQTVVYPIPGEARDLPFSLCVLTPGCLSDPPWSLRPSSTPPGKTSSAPPRVRPQPPREGPVHVLIVEDNDINRILMETILRRLNWTFHCASTGKEAVQAHASEGFDLILMDLHMPDMDGYQAARRIRSQESKANPATPILAVTADVTPGVYERCLEAGMNDYVSKPLNLDDLSSKMEALLGKPQDP
jgi:PAS domain S-box-containing protein